VSPSCAHLDEEEHVDRLQEECLDGKEIAGEELVLEVCHEMTPTGRTASLRGRGNAMPFQDDGDHLFTEVMAYFEQFTLDFPVAPIGILTGEPHDQPFEVPWCAGASACLLSPIRPLAPDHLAMPS
jgi:hypothetical protein